MLSQATRDTSARRVWKVAALVLLLLSILANLVWVSIPFSGYGLGGRSRILYGHLTLLQTFSFHPLGWLWWILLGLQVFAALALAAGVLSSRDRLVGLCVFGMPAAGLLLLDFYIAYRWAAIALWTMYVTGAIPGVLLLFSLASLRRSR